MAVVKTEAELLAEGFEHIDHVKAFAEHILIGEGERLWYRYSDRCMYIPGLASTLADITNFADPSDFKIPDLKGCSPEVFLKN